MTLTLLLDLDDTLLANDMDTFVPAYLQALSTYMAPYADPPRWAKTLLAATNQMIANLDANRTLEQTFDTHFYPLLNLKKGEVRARLDTFYAEEFPKLRHHTQPNPEAIRIVQTAFARDYCVAIATNPLFPLTAVVQRLMWAGLSPKEYAFALIPSFETFHFAKPHPDYYTEVMARLAWPEGGAVMVGDSLENDILPARGAGLATFWLKPDQAKPPEDTTGPHSSGVLADLLPWLDSLTPGALQPDFSSTTSLLATLRSTPAALHSLCAGLEAAAWVRRPESGEWSATEILCHLRDVDTEVNLPRLQRVIQETNPFLAGKDTDPWAVERAYIQQDGRQALQAFTADRYALLALLEGLPPEGWDRPARHAIFGPTPLHELVNFIAGHDRLHIRQFQRVTSP